MIFKYNKFLVTMEWLLLIAAGVVFFWFTFGNNPREFYKSLMFIVTFFTVLLIKFSGEQDNRKVELTNDYAKFYSFRVRMTKKPVTVVSAYADIRCIKARWLPIVGVWGVNVNVSDFSKDLIVTWFFNDFKTLKKELVRRTLENNPDAEIDERLLKKVR